MIPLIVEAALRSFVLVATVWLALAILRPRNIHIEKMTWAVVLLASLAMPLLMTLLMTLHIAPVIRAPQYMLTLRAGDAAQTKQNLTWSAITVLYALPAITLLLRYTTAFLGMWRVRRDARALEQHESNVPDVRVSQRMHSPATFGSTVMLPAEYVNWSARKLSAVMAHERSHVANGDCYLMWLARLHTCLFWFNPLAWWIQRRLALLAETSSDEAAAMALGDQPGYAEILLEFAQTQQFGRSLEVTTAMARPNISARIERILSGAKPSATPKATQRALLILALLPAIAAAAAPLAAPTASDTTTTQTQPSIKKFPELSQYYPRGAMSHGIEGVVDIEVTLDAQGRATDTLILSEDPQEMGFGAAASSVTHAMEYNNPSGRPAQFSFRVKFALGQATSKTTNFEQPDGP